MSSHEVLIESALFPLRFGKNAPDAGLTNLANKNTGCPVKLQFQIKKMSNFFNISISRAKFKTHIKMYVSSPLGVVNTQSYLIKG